MDPVWGEVSMAVTSWVSRDISGAVLAGVVLAGAVLAGAVMGGSDCFTSGADLSLAPSEELMWLKIL